MQQNEAPVENKYLAQVMQEQAAVQRDLKMKRAMPEPRQAAAGRARAVAGDVVDDERRAVLGGSATVEEAPAVEVRITGWWRWRRVIVPPNAYVVHTRLGKPEPLHCGLGISFPFDPATDSYLVVPAAMQTIVINANCICKERQGILVQGYVQWIIEDFRTAYRKLDFSDLAEPMRVVNVQLREQAEAAIKDTVATMSINDVLWDKQPIIKVLTLRLRQLAEGDGKEQGLGLRIMTVQIKEAVVSSARVWESLQRAFRAERQKEARLAELTHEGEVQRREGEAEKEQSAREIAAEEEISGLRAAAEGAAFDREHAERVRRAQVEAEALSARTAHERARLESEAELERARAAQQVALEQAKAEDRGRAAAAAFDLEQAERVRRGKVEAETLAATSQHERTAVLARAELRRAELEAELAEEGLRQDAADRHAARAVELSAARRRVDNDISPALLQHWVVQQLPAIAEKLPRPTELRTISIGGPDGLSALVGEVSQLLQRVRGDGQGAAPPA